MSRDTIEDADVLAELRDDERNWFNPDDPMLDHGYPNWSNSMVNEACRRLARARREARELRADLARMDEVRSHGCECGAEDACRFVRERDDLREALSGRTMWDAAAVEREACLRDVDAEPELPDDPPQAMVTRLAQATQEEWMEVLRVVVRVTKQEIAARIRARGQS